MLGDEIAMRAALYGADFGAPSDVMPRVARAAAAGKSKLGGAAAALRTLAKMPRLLGTAQSHCEVGERLAERFGFGTAFRSALLQSFERWDGAGWPRKIAGEKLATAIRLAHVGEVVETAHRSGGVEGARATAKKRAKQEFDPKLVARFDESAAQVCAVLDVPSAWTSGQHAGDSQHHEHGVRGRVATTARRIWHFGTASVGKRDSAAEIGAQYADQRSDRR